MDTHTTTTATTATPDSATLSLHLGQPGMGMDYDPMLPLPYPIHVDPDGRSWNVPGSGYPLAHRGAREDCPVLLGFQPDPTTMEVVLLAEEWRQDPQRGVGLVPVFREPHGSGMFAITVLVRSID